MLMQEVDSDGGRRDQGQEVYCLSCRRPSVQSSWWEVKLVCCWDLEVVMLPGADFVEANPIDLAVTDGNLVTAAAWPGDNELD